jgi:hypothetical protein
MHRKPELRYEAAPWPTLLRGQVSSEAESPGDHTAPVHHAGDVDLRRPVDPRDNGLSDSRPYLIGAEGPPDTGADAGRSLQGTRSA